MTSTLQVDELTVHVEGQGAQTVVMVHGWPDTQALWDQQVAAMRDNYRCARFTLPGFGGGHTRRGYQLDNVVTQLLAVLDAVSPLLA